MRSDLARNAGTSDQPTNTISPTICETSHAPFQIEALAPDTAKNVDIKRSGTAAARRLTTPASWREREIACPTNADVAASTPAPTATSRIWCTPVTVQMIAAATAAQATQPTATKVPLRAESLARCAGMLVSSASPPTKPDIDAAKTKATYEPRSADVIDADSTDATPEAPTAQSCSTDHLDWTHLLLKAARVFSKAP